MLNVRICVFVVVYILSYNNLPYKSLNEKFKAWVGKYLITLIPFPLQRDNTPSCYTQLLKQSIIPLYLCPFNLVFYPCVWMRSLILSIGAQTVLEITPAVPPAMKS